MTKAERGRLLKSAEAGSVVIKTDFFISYPRKCGNHNLTLKKINEQIKTNKT